MVGQPCKRESGRWTRSNSALKANCISLERPPIEVRKISKEGIISTVAGRGYEGFFGDGGPAEKAMMKAPAGVAIDSKGNVYISDMGNNRIRKVDPKGIISTYAGTGAFGWGREGESVEIYFQNFP